VGATMVVGATVEVVLASVVAVSPVDVTAWGPAQALATNPRTITLRARERGVVAATGLVGPCDEEAKDQPSHR
jgi:hypothetical protein